MPVLRDFWCILAITLFLTASYSVPWLLFFCTNVDYNEIQILYQYLFLFLFLLLATVRSLFNEKCVFFRWCFYIHHTCIDIRSVGSPSGSLPVVNLSAWFHSNIHRTIFLFFSYSLLLLLLFWNLNIQDD